jgi:predicted dehydrogenase
MENRRSFVAKTGLGLAAGYLNLNPAAKGANERVTLGLIGGHNQGRNVALRAIENGAVIKTFCDLDEDVIRKVSPQFEKAQHRAPAPAKDFRTLLDDKELDGVIIAVPDHWHTHIGLLACQAGKDIYIEKPLSQTIREGQMLRDAARKYNRIAQVGTQRRSGEHFREAVEYATSGKLGKICLVRAWTYQLRESIGNPPDGMPPSTADYDLWLGPAPARPFNPNRFHYKWRFFWDYGNSELGNMGVHVLDVAMRGVQNLRGVKNCLPRRIYSGDGIYWLRDAKEIPDTQLVTFDYGDFLLTWELRSFAQHPGEQEMTAGTSFHGSEGSLIVGVEGWKVTSSKGKLIASNPSDSEETLLKAHLKNFVECVKSRKTPNGDIELGRLSTTMCHLGNISHHLKRAVEFDPETETFGADAAANQRLTKEYRAKYPLPTV